MDASEPEHLFFDHPAELHPWRPPVACMRGCMALSVSIGDILKNVAAARQASFGTMYKVKPSASGSPRSATAGRGTSRLSDAFGCSGEALSLETLGTSSAYSGQLNGCNSGRRSGAVVALKSSRSQQKASARFTGATLLDLARNPNSTGENSPLRSPQQPLGQPSPLLIHSTISRSIDSVDVVRGSGVASASPMNDHRDSRTYSSFGSRLGNKGRGQFHSVGRSSGGGGGEGSRTSQLFDAEHAASDAVMVGSATRRCDDSRGSAQPRQQQSSNDRERTPSPPPVVPEIPHFAAFMTEKERLLRQLEEEQRQSGRPPAAAMRGSTALASRNSDDADGQHTGSSANGNSPRSPNAPSPAALAAGGTARPPRLADSEDPSGIDGVNERYGDVERIDRGSADAASSSSGSSGSEMEAQHASEANFGEDGHLPCLPGECLSNRYILVRQLGLGRSSRVWLAMDLEQCSPARRQLIKELGEEQVRKLFNPKERPMFVAIKVFRCGETYTGCATYESMVMAYLKEGTKSAATGSRRRQSTLEASFGTDGAPGHGARAAQRSHPSTSTVDENISDESTDKVPASLSPKTPAAAHSRQCSAATSAFFLSLSRANRSSRSAGLGAVALGLGPRGSGFAPWCGHYVATMRDHFTVEGEYGTHHCLVMDVVGAGVDEAINETRLRGMPTDVVRSIMASSLQGLSVLAQLHVVHTDIKPENLLFIDLEEKVAGEMEDFQRSRLTTNTFTGLWNSSVYTRVSVAVYAAAQRHGGASSTESLDARHSASAGCVGIAGLSSTRPQDTAAAVDSHGVCLNAARTRTATGSHKDSRTLYEVRVSDYGLSFIVPPALREGVDVMMELSAAYAHHQRRRTNASSRSGSVANTADLNASVYDRSGRNSIDGGIATTSSFDSQSDEGEALLRLDPLVQLRLVQQRHQLLVDSARKRGGGGEEEEEVAAARRQGRARRRTGEAGAEGDVSPSLMGSPGSQAGLCNSRADDGVPLGSSTSSSMELSLGGSSHPTAAAAAVAGGGSGGRARVDVLSSLLLRSAQPPSEVELNVLREQSYGRGLTIQSREYRAPEVILGGYFLPSCDVWSMGCVAYELVTGGFLFDVSEDYQRAMDKRVEKRRERQREQRQWSGARGRRQDESDEDHDDDNEDEDEYERAHGDAEWEDDDLLHAPLYFADEPERDLDAIHLKSMMRLLGPPPLAYLNHRPYGVYVDRFFDMDGNFLCLESYSIHDDEEEETGFCEVRPYRQLELRAAGSLGGTAASTDALHYAMSIDSTGAHHGSGATPYEMNGTATIATNASAAAGGAQLRSSLAPQDSGPIVYRYSDDDDDGFEKQLAEMTGGADSSHVRVVHATTKSTEDRSRESNAHVAMQMSASAATDATPSTVAITPDIEGGFHESWRFRSSGHLSGSAAGGGHPALLLPRDPHDRSNYPIRTQRWRRLQSEIREHLDTEEEARAFEKFLLQCLQWDPAQRATPADLLASEWLVRFGPLATSTVLSNAAAHAH